MESFEGVLLTLFFWLALAVRLLPKKVWKMVIGSLFLSLGKLILWWVWGEFDGDWYV